MKRQFCLPCFLEIKKAGKHDIERVRGGVNMKITCWRCKRRRYGAEYEISRKGGVSRDNGGRSWTNARYGTTASPTNE